MPSKRQKVNETSNPDEPQVVPFNRISTISPDYFTINIPYFDEFALDTTGAGRTIEKVAVAMNDPRVPVRTPTTTGGVWTDIHQPRGWGTWSSVFTHYRVVATNIRIDFYQCGMASVTSLQGPGVMAVGWRKIANNDIGADWATIRDMFEQKDADADLIECASNIAANKTMKTFNVSYNNDEFGQNHHFDDAVSFSGNTSIWTPIGSSPTVPHLLYIGACATTIGDEDNSVAKGSVRVMYTVQFRNPNSAQFEEDDA